MIFSFIMEIYSFYITLNFIYRTYIKKQKDIKEEIAKISSQEISRIREDTTRLNQVIYYFSSKSFILCYLFYFKFTFTK